MGSDDLGNLIAHAHDRAQGKSGLLMDQGNLRATNCAQLFLGKPQQVLFSKQNRTLNLRVRWKQSQD